MSVVFRILSRVFPESRGSRVARERSEEALRVLDSREARSSEILSHVQSLLMHVPVPDRRKCNRRAESEIPSLYPMASERRRRRDRRRADE